VIKTLRHAQAFAARILPDRVNPHRRTNLEARMAANVVA
jgi:hypothetical protein